MDQKKETLQKRESGIIINPSNNPNELIKSGNNIKSALFKDKAYTKTYLMTAVIDLVEFIDAKKTLENNDHVIFTVESIIENHPTLTIEEITLIFKRMKQAGKYYERLKTPEILEALIKYESDERARYLEEVNKAEDKNIVIQEIDYEAYGKRLQEESERPKQRKESSLNLLTEEERKQRIKELLKTNDL